jgi:galactokinase
LRAECDRAARELGRLLGRPVRFLRDVSAAEFEAAAARLDEPERSRAAHVIAENDRVLRGIEALKAGDTVALGRLMFASHVSSRDLLGNSTPELDLLVDTAATLPGCIGAKLCGGGFGGSTVNLVENGDEEEFAACLAAAYERAFSRPPRVLHAGIGDGARARKLGPGH